MNLMDNPKQEQLAELLSKCDDEVGNHLLWVDKDGNVRIDLLDNKHPFHGTHPASWPNAKFRFETYAAGMNYAGLETSRDAKYVKYLYNVLIENWAKDAVGFIDSY